MQLNPSACHYLICCTFNWSKNKTQIECLLKTTGNRLKKPPVFESELKQNISKLSENCFLYYAAQWFVWRERNWCNIEITILIIHSSGKYTRYLQIKCNISLVWESILMYFSFILNICWTFIYFSFILNTRLTNQPNHTPADNWLLPWLNNTYKTPSSLKRSVWHVCAYSGIHVCIYKQIQQKTRSFNS